MAENTIIIIGAGFAGIGACECCRELGIKNFRVFERNPSAGGLAASFEKDGFTWDIGGHVLFSHYPRFDSYVEDALDGTLKHNRESYINLQSGMIPYPFQNNIGFLPEILRNECIEGLRKIQDSDKKLKNFREFIYQNFGSGIARIFMEPYNTKVWKQNLNHMSADWIAERVAPVSLEYVLKNIAENKADISWGPNNRFLFPAQGGTGALFKKAEEKYSEHISFNSPVRSISFKNRTISVNGKTENYNSVISTIPVSELIRHSDAPVALKKDAATLTISGGYMVGIGLSGNFDHTRCWVYFPEAHSPFYRVTYFSNYAESNAPKGMVSLLCETSYSKYMPYTKDIVQDTIDGLVNERIITHSQRQNIVSTWCMHIPFSYPVPTIERNRMLKNIHSFLESHNVYSRGRFGGFLYETGNMDHSFMQGYEAVLRIIENSSETVFSLAEV